MATIIANGNASIMSRAMYDTEDGYFEHATGKALNSRKLSNGSFSSYVPYQNGYNKSTGPSNRASSAQPKIYGESTVWVDGVPYPNSHWAKKRIQPVKNPYGDGWIDPKYLDSIKAYHEKKDSSKKSASDFTKNTLNKVSGAVGKEIDSASNASTQALREYQSKNWRYNRKTGQREYTGNAVGETAARLRGAVSGSAIGREASAISKGANNARQAYIDAHTNVQIQPKDGHGYPEFKSYNGSKLGETAAAIRGGIGASAVGRAGKAAFKAITDKFEEFKSGIQKYLTGENAGKNRMEALSSLREKAGGLMGAISTALGTSEGRSGLLSKMAGGIGSVIGGAAGVARGIAKSDVGKAAINAGKNAYGVVKNGVDAALRSIQKFFTRNTKVNSGGGGAVSLSRSSNARI